MKNNLNLGALSKREDVFGAAARLLKSQPTTTYVAGFAIVILILVTLIVTATMLAHVEREFFGDASEYGFIMSYIDYAVFSGGLISYLSGSLLLFLLVASTVRVIVCAARFFKGMLEVLDDEHQNLFDAAVADAEFAGEAVKPRDADRISKSSRAIKRHAELWLDKRVKKGIQEITVPVVDDVGDAIPLYARLLGVCVLLVLAVIGSVDLLVELTVISTWFILAICVVLAAIVVLFKHTGLWRLSQSGDFDENFFAMVFVFVFATFPWDNPLVYVLIAMGLALTVVYPYMAALSLARSYLRSEILRRMCKNAPVS